MKMRGRIPLRDADMLITPRNYAESMQPDGIPVKLFTGTPDERTIGKARVTAMTDEGIDIELTIDDGVIIDDIDAGRWSA